MATIEPSSFIDAETMDSLLLACSSGNPSSLSHLLSSPKPRSLALAEEERQCNKICRTFPNLQLLLKRAAGAGHANCFSLLFTFGQDNDFSYQTLVTRDLLLATISSHDLDTLKTILHLYPEAVNQELGHMCSPLAQTLLKDLYPHTQYLLEHCADPNTRLNAYRAHGYYLHFAAKNLSLKYTRLLLEHGAIVPESGAMQMAAQKGRLGLLKLLVEHGGNINERVDHNMGFYTYNTKKKVASETLLHIAVKNGHVDVAKWLLEEGADVRLVDLKGESASDIARRTGDDEMRAVFEKSEAE